MRKSDILEISESEIGKEYLKELREVLAIRINRRPIYGDSFLIESTDSLLNIIDGKRRRFENIFLKQSKSKADKDKIIDELRDVVNYYIFAICVLKKSL